MTDAELLAAVSRARGEAHRAPFAEWSMDHKGHSAIVNHTSAWETRGYEFARLYQMCLERGLKLPPCDCPAGAHDQGRAALLPYVKREMGR